MPGGSIQPPQHLQNFLKVTVGMEWPEGSEGGLKEIHNAWMAFKDMAQNAKDDLGPVGRKVADSMDGSAARLYADSTQKDLPEILDSLISSADEMGKSAMNASASSRRRRS